VRYFCLPHSRYSTRSRYSCALYVSYYFSRVSNMFLRALFISAPRFENFLSIEASGICSCPFPFINIVSCVSSVKAVLSKYIILFILLPHMGDGHLKLFCSSCRLVPIYATRRDAFSAPRAFTLTCTLLIYSAASGNQTNIQEFAPPFFCSFNLLSTCSAFLEYYCAWYRGKLLHYLNLLTRTS